MTFKNIIVGETFDFIHSEWYGPSFFRPCQKISARKYRDDIGQIHEVGTINTTVFHLNEHANKFPTEEE